MRWRRMAAGITLCTVLALGGAEAATAAPATAPLNVSGDLLVDTANALSSADEQTAESALKQYQSDTGDTVHVVFVPTFTDPADPKQWATATGQRSQSGADDALVLAVAMQSRQFSYAVANGFPLSTGEVDAVITKDVKPQLATSKWSAAVTALTAGLKQAESGSATSGNGTSNSGTDGTTTASDSGGSGAGVVVTLLLLAALVVVIVVLVRIARRRRVAVPAGAGSGSAPVAQPVDQKALDQQASRALIALDDDLTTSEQELGFASAEFGDAATTDFTAALESARATSRQAFQIRQLLDDDTPETPAQRQEMTQRIIALCGQAEQTLSAQTASFDELRKLEQQLPAAVPAATADRDRLAKRADDAASALDALRTQFGNPAVEGAADDLRQARDLLALAGTALTQTAAAQTAGKAGEGAVALRGAQQALGQAGTLLDGIVAAPGEFIAAKRRLDAAVDDTRSDIAEAQRLQGRAVGDQKALTAAIRGAQDAVDAAALQAPTVGLAAVEAANGRLDAALAGARGDAERLSRARAGLPRTLDAAQQSVSACKRFIDSRRGGIGSTARTRISEAQRELDSAVALEHDDPVAALAAAQRAQAAANEAYDLAQRDVDDFRSGGGFGGGGGLGGGGNVLGGAILAGVLGGILSGGGRGGGWGGGGWGDGGYGGDGGFGGGGGWAGGGFGGGGDGGGWSGGGGDFGGGGGDGGGGGGGF